MSKRKDVKSDRDRVVYSEFGNNSNSAAFERAIQELPPSQQKIRVQSSKKGRKGKTVTIISGFQSKPETLSKLLKQLKGLCGAGGTVKEMTLEIQGDHRDKIIEKLTQLGYNAR
ncbi:MAG: translation initiation factor [Prochloraceae cyanobacterium]